MNTTSIHQRLGFAALVLSTLFACGAAHGADPFTFAALQDGGKTAQGGQHEAFAYSEKPGDASVDKVVLADGVARITGNIWPQKGSTWAGIGFMVSAGAGDKTVDLSAHKTVRLQLASASAKQLRVRVMGLDKATRDAGCYPIVVLPISPELREIEVPLARFAPDGYCGAKGRSIADTAKAVAAIEVSDPTLAPGTRHAVDFQVGRIELKP